VPVIWFRMEEEGEDWGGVGILCCWIILLELPLFIISFVGIFPTWVVPDCFCMTTSGCKFETASFALGIASV
jgi:hypothetical protein